MNRNKYFSLCKELISEQIIIPNIKFINFSPKEIQKFNSLDEFYLIRKAEDLRDFALTDLIKTEWRKSL